MIERLRVAVLTGGPSAEHEVSLQSARAVLDALPKERYDPVLVVIDRKGNWSLELRRSMIDIVFPVLHGPFGEDGVVQGHLETLGLPYVAAASWRRPWRWTRPQCDGCFWRRASR